MEKPILGGYGRVCSEGGDTVRSFISGDVTPVALIVVTGQGIPARPGFWGHWRL